MRGGAQEHQAFPAGVTGEAEGAQRSVADRCAGGHWGASHRPCAAPAHAREGPHSRAAGGGGGAEPPHTAMAGRGQPGRASLRRYRSGRAALLRAALRVKAEGRGG